MRTHLTDIVVKTLKPSDRQVDHFCTSTRNFGLRISPKGRKTFFALVGPSDARQRVTLGTYPDISLKDARQKAGQTTSKPKSVRGPTYAHALDAYLKVVKANYRPHSAYLTERLLRLHFEDLLSKHLSTFTAAGIYGLLDDLPPSEANHAFGAFKTFLNWAATRYSVPSPLQLSKKPHKERSRSRTLSDAELAAIWKACPSTHYGAVVKSLILSGQRRGEIAGLRSAWMTADAITFPASITKNKTDHTIPLTPALAAVLRPDVAYNGWGKHKAALDKASGITGWTLHDLRRTFSTNLARLGIPVHVTERLLNHRSGSLTPLVLIYNRYSYLPEMRQALEQHDAFIAQITGSTKFA